MHMPLSHHRSRHCCVKCWIYIYHVNNTYINKNTQTSRINKGPILAVTAYMICSVWCDTDMSQQENIDGEKLTGSQHNLLEQKDNYKRSAQYGQYVVSKVFHITGDNVSFVCNVTKALPFCELLIHRNVTFLKNLQKFHSQHLVIGYLVRHSGKNKLHELYGGRIEIVKLRPEFFLVGDGRLEVT